MLKQGVVEVTLSGSLGFVPLDEVLRLLSRAGQSGAIAVRGDDIHGRVFVTQKGVVLATTSDDVALRAHLLNSEFIDEGHLRSVESGSASLESISDSHPGLIDLLREMTVESLFQMTSHGATFEVDEEARTPFESPKPFELEGVLDDARRRSGEWSEIETSLTDLAGVIKMKRDLGDRDEITLGRDAWKLISELGAGSSVGEMADRLGTTKFWTARVASDLTSSDLLYVVGDDEPVTEPEPEYRTEAEHADDGVESPAESEAEAEAEADPNESWWEEPEAEDVDSGEVEEATEEVASVSRFGAFTRSRTGLSDADNETAPTDPETEFENVEDDTEAFLEQVFSELDPPKDETEGHGLLKRRRFGTTLEDAPNTKD
ncbi:MAG: DUF4388 domain-containing protein [Actinobacteria bacterium]|nr:DUF4388 domain-containing protein [Actinomycetota bacterium]